MHSLDLASALAAISAELCLRGYATVMLAPEQTRADLLQLTRALSRRTSGDHRDDLARRWEAIETRPSEDAPIEEPFNRAEAIGWHNDFTTHTVRPRLTLSCIDRPDPRGPEFGAWRVAACDDVLTRLRRTEEGMRALHFLRDTPLPFLAAGGDEPEPAVFRALEERGPHPGRLGMRFYARAMRAGSVALQGRVLESLEAAIRMVEEAADAEAVTVAASRGSVLVVDNWHCLHDRTVQTTDPALPSRRALLCFVA